MPPETSCLCHFNKLEMELDVKGIGWKDFMNECLLKTEILKPNEQSPNETCLDPNKIMSARHKMVRSSNKLFPASREQIQTEALKLLREETHSRLLKQKQGKVVEKEIERLKQFLEKHRQISKKQLEEAATEKTKGVKTIFPKFEGRYTRLWKRCESYDGTCEVDTWVNTTIQTTMETRMSEEGIPIDVRVSMKRRRELKEEISAPVSCNRKGSVVDEGEERVSLSWRTDDGKDNVMGQVLDEEDADEAWSRDGGLEKVKNAWKFWRSFTLQRRKRKRELAMYQNKIEAFLAKIEGKVVTENQRCKSCSQPSKNKNVTRRERAKTAQEKKTDIVKRGEEKEQKLQKLMRDVKTSQAEVCERLRAIEKHNERVKVLKTFAGVCEEVKTRRKIPNFLVRMETRREERIKRWREVEERKRKIEDERKNAQRKREEEEKRKKLEKLKEKRRLEKEKKEEQMREREKLSMADGYHRMLLLRSYGLRPWLKLIRLRNAMQEHAVSFCDSRLLLQALSRWRENVAFQAEKRRIKAEDFHESLLKRDYFLAWVEFREERVRQRQVAVDWNEFKTTERVFGIWLQFTQQEQLEYLNKKEMAVLNHQLRVKRKYLKKWREYPELKRLERAKENRKRIWRQKVKEILPDYRPIDTSDS